MGMDWRGEGGKWEGRRKEEGVGSARIDRWMDGDLDVLENYRMMV